MSRLTKKNKNGFVPKYERETKENYYDLVCKLGRLEDIEDNIGVDLLTLFKALTNGIYIKFGNKKITGTECYTHSYILPRHIYEDEKGWVIDLTIELDMNHCLYLKDYGKTWALTIKELEECLSEDDDDFSQAEADTFNLYYKD